MPKVLVCAAWPYANGIIHLGHLAGSILPPDIFSRYNKLLGNEVLMVSGSDQHGTPITVSADREGVSPCVIADRYHEVNKKAIEDMDIEFSLFTKTHSDNHLSVVNDIFNTLLDNGYLYIKKTDQYFCTKCEKFLPDRYIEGVCPKCGAEKCRGDQCDSCGAMFEVGELDKARCTNCGIEPEIRPTEHYFFKLSAFSEPLLKYLDEKKWWRSNVISFTSNWLRNGLNDRAVTRDMEWGIPVPVEGWEKKVIYVWFDAVIGYLSASKEYSRIIGKPDYWESFWKDPKVKHYYFLGKDNIPFHSIIWPSILMGYGGLNLPYDIPANEYLMFNGGKLSKSRGGAIDVPTVLKKHDSDVIRFYLSSVMPDTHDSEFTWEDFQIKINNELVSNLGNYYHRCLSFTQRNFEVIPEPDEDELGQIANKIRETFDEYCKYMDSCDFKKAIKVVMELSKFGNRYFDSMKPWILIKSDKKRCGSVMNANLMLVKALVLMSWPFMPKASEKIWGYLGIDEPLRDVGFTNITRPLTTEFHLTKPTPVFRKIEFFEGVKTPELKKNGENSKLQVTPLIDFKILDIRVGQIVWIDDHSGADNLYHMKVDVGEEQPRSIVAGLKRYYKKEELFEKKVLCLCNLKPSKLRGILSEGMLLAADDEELGGSTVLLLEPSRNVPVGTSINSGCENNSAEIRYEDFTKVTLKVVHVEGGKFELNGNSMDVEVPVNAPCYVAVAIDGSKVIALSDGDGCFVTVDGELINGANIR
ncbi:MAG: methionine--tRNA ligase [archaeon]|nr:methionine--tRNA ligase [archaeon]